MNTLTGFGVCLVLMLAVIFVPYFLSLGFDKVKALIVREAEHPAGYRVYRNAYGSFVPQWLKVTEYHYGVKTSRKEEWCRLSVFGSRGYYHDRGSVSTQAEAEEIIRNHQKLVADIKRHDIELREAAKHEGVVKEFGPTYDSILRRIK